MWVYFSVVEKNLLNSVSLPSIQIIKPGGHISRMAEWEVLCLYPPKESKLWQPQVQVSLWEL